MDYERDESTGCLLWRGSVSSDDYPVIYRGGRQELVVRTLFGANLAPLPAWCRLSRVCSTSRCVNPYHHVLQAPRAVAKHLGFGAHDLRGIVELLRAKAARQPAFGLAWRTYTPQYLGLKREEVDDWAARLSVPPLLVLAALATLVASDRRSALEGEGSLLARAQEVARSARRQGLEAEQAAR